MKTKWMTTVSAVLLLVSVSGRTSASWADIPLDDLIADADRVVVGRIEAEGEPFGMKDSRALESDGKHWHVVGILAVQETLKGPKSERIRLAYPKRPAAPGFIILSGAEDITYRVGQEGIWILTQDRNGGDYYWATYPKDYQPAERKGEVFNAFERLKSRRYGKPMNGLALFAQSAAPSFISGEPLLFKVGLRNLTSKEINFGGSPFMGVMRLTLLDERGKPITSVSRSDAPTTEEEKQVWESGRNAASLLLPHQDTHDYTFLLSRMELPPQKPGNYRLQATFTETRMGERPVPEGIWKGTLRVNLPVKVVIR